jgi:hypothetical protein
MAEWSMAVVLKTTKVQAFGGSNPSPSANSNTILAFVGLDRNMRYGARRVIVPPALIVNVPVLKSASPSIEPAPEAPLKRPLPPVTDHWPLP